jgi:hypothetical protein
MRSLEFAHRILLTGVPILLLGSTNRQPAPAPEWAVTLAPPAGRSAGHATVLVKTTAQEDIYVGWDYLVDSDGYQYGASYYLSSTVNARTCVYPRIVERTNVNGTVTEGPVLLQPNESRVAIGSFISADQSQPWSVDVAARWTRC